MAERMSTPAAAPRAAGAFLAACRRQPVAHRPDLDHAPGGALPARVPGAARQGRLRDADTHAGPGSGGDPAAAAALRTRRRDPLQRHHDAAAGHGRGPRLRARPGGARSRSAATRRSMPCPRWCRSATCRSCCEAIRLVRANLPRGAPLIGFAGAPVHALVLPRRRPAVQGVRCRARVSLCTAAIGAAPARRTWRTPWRNTSPPRRRPAPRR